MPPNGLTAYADVLGRTGGVSAWIVRRVRASEHQRYLLADQPEAYRTVERTSVRITVFHEHAGGQGQATITLHGDQPLETRAVEEAVFRASLEGNPPYALPEPGEPRHVEGADPALEADAGRALDEVEERVFSAAAREKDVRLSASEIFVTRSEREILTSRGVRLHEPATSLMMELTLISHGAGGAEAESFGGYGVRRVADLHVSDIVARHAERARHKLLGALPSSGTVPVVMSEGTFEPLFGPITFATSGRAIYREISPLAPGEPVFGERTVEGDALSLVSDATLPFAAETRGFDDEGLCLARVPVIEHGVFRTIVADKRHADYLEIAPTGDWHNRVVAPGARPLAELLDGGDGPVLHVVEFSWLNPDHVRGNFSTEIRLAYEHLPTGERRIVTGGSLAGNAYEAFAHAYFSSETELSGGYSGPTAVRFGALRVAGA